MRSNYMEMEINMAYSILNMRLRDKYPNLEELCQEEGIEEKELLEYLERQGVLYNCEKNQFYFK